MNSMEIERVQVLSQTTQAQRALGSMAALAILDLAGALIARRYAVNHSSLALAGGCIVFAALFWVYGRSLAYAELATVTIGWIVLLQVGVLFVSRFLDGVSIPPGKWIAIVAILLLQGYLLLAPST